MLKHSSMSSHIHIELRIINPIWILSLNPQRRPYTSTSTSSSPSPSPSTNYLLSSLHHWHSSSSTPHCSSLKIKLASIQSSTSTPSTPIIDSINRYSYSLSLLKLLRMLLLKLIIGSLAKWCSWLVLLVRHVTTWNWILTWEWSNVFMHVWSWYAWIVEIMNKMASCSMTTADLGVEVSARNSSVIWWFVLFFLNLLFHGFVHKFLLINWILRFFLYLILLSQSRKILQQILNLRIRTIWIMSFDKISKHFFINLWLFKDL